jgi:hypothetical protein
MARFCDLNHLAVAFLFAGLAILCALCGPRLLVAKSSEEMPVKKENNSGRRTHGAVLRLESPCRSVSLRGPRDPLRALRSKAFGREEQRRNAREKGKQQRKTNSWRGFAT